MAVNDWEVFKKATADSGKYAQVVAMIIARLPESFFVRWVAIYI